MLTREELLKIDKDMLYKDIPSGIDVRDLFIKPKFHIGDLVECETGPAIVTKDNLCDLNWGSYRNHRCRFEYSILTKNGEQRAWIDEGGLSLIKKGTGDTSWSWRLDEFEKRVESAKVHGFYI